MKSKSRETGANSVDLIYKLPGNVQALIGALMKQLQHGESFMFDGTLFHLDILREGESFSHLQEFRKKMEKAGYPLILHKAVNSYLLVGIYYEYSCPNLHAYLETKK